LTPVILDGLLFHADDVVAEWVNSSCGGGKVFAPYVAIGVVSAKDGLTAGAVFHSYSGVDVTVTAAAARPSLRLRSAIRAGLSYAFQQLRVSRVSAEIELENVRMIRLAEGLGFVREGVKRKAAANGKHVGVFGLLQKDFKI
jgi:hypothetical protein